MMVGEELRMRLIKELYTTRQLEKEMSLFEDKLVDSERVPGQAAFRTPTINNNRGSHRISVAVFMMRYRRCA